MPAREKPILEFEAQAFSVAVDEPGSKPICEISNAGGRQALEHAQAVPGTKLPADVKNAWLGAFYQGINLTDGGT